MSQGHLESNSFLGNNLMFVDGLNYCLAQMIFIIRWRVSHESWLLPLWSRLQSNVEANSFPGHNIIVCVCIKILFGTNDRHNKMTCLAQNSAPFRPGHRATWKQIHFQAITLLFVDEIKYCLAQMIVITGWRVTCKLLVVIFKVKVTGVTGVTLKQSLFRAITLLFIVEFRYCLVQLIVITRGLVERKI